MRFAFRMAPVLQSTLLSSYLQGVSVGSLVERVVLAILVLVVTVRVVSRVSHLRECRVEEAVERVTDHAPTPTPHGRA